MQTETIYPLRILDKRIEVFAIGKWRPIRYYQGKGIPSNSIQKELIHTISINTGTLEDCIKLKWQPTI